MEESVLETSHGATVAFTAVHGNSFSNRLGGVRFVEHGSVDEVRHLASGMADKCAAARVPVDGQKTLVICPHGVPASPAERAAVLAEHIRRVVAKDPRGIFGPDMACGNEVLDLLADDPSVAPHITGLSETHGGLGINRHAFTARGVVHAFASITKNANDRVGSATVQGFGMVGAPVAKALWRRGIVVRAVSNVTGTLVSTLGTVGLDVPRLFAMWRELGDASLAAYAETDPCARFVPDPNELFAVRAQLFVPAARTTVLARAEELEECRQENQDVRSVEEFLERTGVEIVLQAANHPLTEAAEEYLERGGVMMLPDVLVNIGGMVGCHAEWRYRRLVRRGVVSLADLAERCHGYTARVVEENLTLLASRTGLARTAARAIVAANRKAMRVDAAGGDLFALDP
jgi:glutamate dehydrogenase (NAD(P)+)